MSKKSTDFWFCKVHFSSDLFNTPKISDFVRALINAANAGTGIRDRNKIWHLGGLKSEVIEDSNTEVLFGKIGKEIFANYKTIYDDDTRDFITTAADETYASYGIFVVDIENYIIAVEAKFTLTLSKVLKKLKEFLPPEVGAYTTFEIMADKFEIYNRVRGWDKFTYAKFQLTPTNPDNDPEFEQLDKLIQNTGGDKAVLVFEKESGVGTLNTDNSSLAMQGIAMSSAGYGNFELMGEKDGHTDKIKTKDRARLKRTFETDGTDIEKKIIDFNRDFKNGKNEKG